MTQERLCHLADCDPKTLRRAEQSKHVDATTLERLADVLNVSTSELNDQRRHGTDRQNVELLFAWNDAFVSCDVDRSMDCFHDEATIEVMFDHHRPGGGRFSGTDAIRMWHEVCFQTLINEPILPDDIMIDVIGDRVFARTRRPMRITSRATGQVAESHGAHDLRIQEGKIRMLQIYADTNEIAKIVNSIEHGLRGQSLDGQD